jgi:dTDP-glucose 4,6-dehydratase
VVEALVRAGASVQAFVRYTSRGDDGLLALCPPDVRAATEVVRGDLRDPEAVRKAVQGAAAVLHLGALVAIPYSYVHPRDVAETNVMGTLNVLLAAREAGALVIHTSTSEVYGTARQVPISEAHPLQGQSPYAASKIGADKLAESFRLSFGLPVVTLRPFNTYGPRQSARAVIPTILSQALLRDRISLGSLHPIRDLTYVEDTAQAFVAAVASDAAVGHVVHLGTGHGVSVAQLVELAGKVLGKRLEVECDAARVRPPTSEVERLVSDPSRARQLLGWEAKVRLEEGIQRTAEWIRANLDTYRTESYVI